jgi:predicted kinase
VPDQQLIVLCGLAFAGKSTLARAIAGCTGAAVVSLDEINARRGLHGGDGVPDEEWSASHREALAEVERLVAAGTRRIVVDDTGCFRFLRDDWRRLAARLDSAFTLVVLDAPLEEIEKRMRANAAEPHRGGIRPGVFERHLAGFEWPGDDEPHVVVSSQADADAWLAEALP